jgi:hypothetical protein
MPAWPWQLRLLQVVGHLRLEEQFRREILFYQDVHPHLQGLRLPRLYYVAMAGAPLVSAWSYVLCDTRTPLRFCILMEDLAVDHFAAVPLGASLPFPRAKQALLNIAQLHAFGWQQSRLWTQLRLRPTPWLLLRADRRGGGSAQIRPSFIPTAAAGPAPASARAARGPPQAGWWPCGSTCVFATWADAAARKRANTTRSRGFSAAIPSFIPVAPCPRLPVPDRAVADEVFLHHVPC